MKRELILPPLMQSATLALCKCMCISKSFCEKHLTLLFSVLVKAPNDDQDLRANIVIAVGDLAFRFPNEVEPYTPKIYACLRDKSTRVRRHTLMVLTHLILNDMVKVKGNVCEIALCLQDQEPRIRDMARLLFHELSKRTNSPIYNLLPDIEPVEPAASQARGIPRDHVVPPQLHQEGPSERNVDGKVDPALPQVHFH